MSQLNKEFQAKYPNVTIKRVSRSFDDLKTTLRLALSGNQPPDVVQANNGRSDMGAFVKAGQLRPLDAYAEAYGWNDALPRVGALSTRHTGPATARRSGRAASTACRRSVRSSASTTTPRSSRPPACSRRRPGPSSSRRWPRSRPRARCRCMFGNLDKWPGDPRLRHGAGPPRAADAVTQLGFGHQGASWTTPENTKAAQTLVDWADKGYFEPGFNGQGYDPAWQAFSQGQGRLPHRRHLAAGRPAEGHGRRRPASCCRPGRPPAPRRSPPAAPGLPFVGHQQEPAPRRGRGVHRLHHRPARHAGADQDRQPARWPTPRPSRSAADCRRTCSPPSARSSRPTACVPYLDYATPTMPRHPGRRAAGPAGEEGHAAAVPAAAAEGLRRLLLQQRLGAAVTVEHAAPGTVEEARQPPRRRAGGGPPGEPRRVAYLYLLPAFLVYAAFLLYPLARSVQLSLLPVGRAEPRHVGGAGQLRRRRARRGAAGGVRARAGAHGVLRRAARWPSAWRSPRSSTGPRSAGWASSAPWCSCRRSWRWSWSAVAWRRIYAPDGTLNALLSAVGLGSLTRGWLGDYTCALPAVGVHRHVVRDRAGHGAAPGRDGPDLR